MKQMSFFSQLSVQSRAKLYSAVFLTFAPMFLMSTSSYAEQRAWPEVITHMIGSGCIAVTYAYAGTQNKKYFAVAFLFQILFAVGIGLVWGRPEFNPSFQSLAFVGAIIGGYILFVSFINSEGAKSIRMQTEISLAQQVHNHLVPPLSISLPHVELYGKSISSEEVGGDLIGAEVKERTAGVYVADVSGHGIKAGVMMSMIKSAITMRQLHNASIINLCDELNTVVNGLKRPEMFVTFACMTINPDRTIQYSIAGHPPILYYSRNEDRIEELSLKTPGLGIMKTFPYPVQHFTANPGDIFVLLTDGIFEVTNTAGTQFGLEQVTSILYGMKDSSPGSLYDGIMSAVHRHGNPDDDQTLLVVKVL